MTGPGTARSGAPAAAYRGRAGETRSETAQVWMPDGHFRTLHVYVSVDASADPALAKAAREGVLHAVTDDVELAVPFVYHDPERPLFVLVIPAVLRHRALELRAECLARVARDTAHEVPAYVAECECVVGPEGLRARLSGEQPASAEWDAAAGESVRVREEDVRVREEELARWEADLEARERELRARSGGPVGSTGPLFVDDAELEDITPPPPSYSEAPDLGLGAVPPLPELGTSRPYRSTLDVDDAELLSEELRPSMLPPPLPFAQLSEPEPSYEDGDVPEPPEAFAADHDQPMLARYFDERVWLYTRGLPPKVEGGELELLIQVEPDAAVPVVLLTLVHSSGGEGKPTVLRYAVPYLQPEGETVLRHLADHFVAELVYVGETGLLSYEARLAAPRESNARAILDHLDRVGDVTPEAYAEAERACLAQPPPWRDPTHPFVTWDEDQQVRSATEAAVELDELSTWLTPAKQRRLSLLLSVPARRVLDHTARAIGDALGFGLALPEPLVDHALARSLVEDQADLLRRRLDGLLHTSRSEDGGGMDEAVLATLWVDALEEATRQGASLDDETIEVAERFVGEKTRLHLRALKASASGEFAAQLEALAGPAPDRKAAEELAAAGGLGELRAVCEAAERMSAPDAAAVYVALAQRGEAAGDALMAELARRGDARSQFGAALALAVRRVPDAIDALVAGVREGDDPAWRGLAHALGHYGGGSFRAISRAVDEARLPRERAVQVYAHLSLRGARSAVLRQARGRDVEKVARAKAAIDLAGQFKSQLADKQGLEAHEALAVFSEQFHALWQAAQT